ncbi:DNA helicase mcm9 [Gonapodya sp. JEL0774]|nr:DNA helicase mcm9 [Gonapodya sp. JEL0774]
MKVGERADHELVLLANYIHARNQADRAAAEVDEDVREMFEEFWDTARKSHREIEGEASSAVCANVEKTAIFSPLQARNLVLASFCPRVFGLYFAKLAVLLVLMGGVESMEAGSKVRGDSHLLLVGDPGTGKSQFLRHAALLIPRTVLTTGVGSTNAGLTVTAVRESGEWQLEAGALVLADRGVCCIDEFGSIKKGEQASVLEAMEQQTISVAKAGIVAKLLTRCSVLAATNPKGSYDPHQSIQVNTALNSPLLSRFDLVLVLIDGKDETWDNKFKPKLNSEAEAVLKAYFLAKRKAEGADLARTTVRLLESLIRLSQAHAKLMFREHVHLQDAVVAVHLMECSVSTSALLGFVEEPVASGIKGVLRSAFPENPDEEYKTVEIAVLTKLGLPELIPQTPHQGTDLEDSKTPLPTRPRTRNPHQMPPSHMKLATPSTEQSRATQVANQLCLGSSQPPKLGQKLSQTSKSPQSAPPNAPALNSGNSFSALQSGGLTQLSMRMPSNFGTVTSQPDSHPQNKPSTLLEDVGEAANGITSGTPSQRISGLERFRFHGSRKIYSAPPIKSAPMIHQNSQATVKDTGKSFFKPPDFQLGLKEFDDFDFEVDPELLDLIDATEQEYTLIDTSAPSKSEDNASANIELPRDSLEEDLTFLGDMGTHLDISLTPDVGDVRSKIRETRIVPDAALAEVAASEQQAGMLGHLNEMELGWDLADIPHVRETSSEVDDSERNRKKRRFLV